MDQDLIRKTKRLLSEHLGADFNRIELSDDLADDWGVDSLDIPDLTMAFETEFCCTIEDFAALKTVRDIVEFLEGHAA